MAFLGHKQGPKLSEIINNLGEGFFGISGFELLEEIDEEENRESQGEVKPVYIDEDNNPFYILCTKRGQKRYYFTKEEIKQLGQNYKKIIKPAPILL